MKNKLGLGTISLVCLALAAGCGGSDAAEVPPDDTGSSLETSSTDDTGSGIDTATTDDTGTTTDSGTTDDTGTTTDSGTTDDTSTPTDTGTIDDTGTPTDSGTPADTSTPADTAVPPDSTTTPTLSIADVTVTEGNTGTRAATFTVTLSAASTTPVTVAFASADGTAKTATGDYATSSGTLTFAPGVTTQTITILVTGDLVYETNETFTIDLSSPTGATLAKASATGTITNDDNAPTLAINNIGATEGNSGTKNFTFNVTLTGLTEVPVTVNWATNNDTATAGTDYVAGTGSLTFAPGDIAKAINVLVNGDTTNEANEQFLVLLSGAVGATIADASGTGMIWNDDGGTATPALRIADAGTTEGNTGTKILNFPVTLSAASTGTVTVNYATMNNTALAGTDFVGTTGTLTFAPGETTKNVPVTINGDLLNEADEAFWVSLNSPSGASIADGFAQGMIANDDALPTLSISDVTLAEGNGGATNYTFTVTLSAASGRDVRVNWVTAAGTATANVDYVSASGALFFPAGTLTRTITVAVRGDTTLEPNETFFVNLNSPFNASIADGQGVGTITNDD